MTGYYAFDLDGTLAQDDGRYEDHIGEPIGYTLALVKKHLERGDEVRILTARVEPEWDQCEEQKRMIEAWCEKYVGQKLPVQAHKTGGMIVLYDDRAVGVQHNTGIPVHLLHLQIDRSVTAARVKHVFYERTGIDMDDRIAHAIAESIHQDIKV